MIPITSEDGRLCFDPAPILTEISRQSDLIKQFLAYPEKIEYNQEEASDVLGLSKATLSQLCSEGRGPRFRCVGGRRRYFLRSDLIAWAESHRRYASMDEYYREHPELRPQIDELKELA